MKITFIACENLTFNTNDIDKRIELKLIGDGVGVYWQRPTKICNENFDVQFCQLRGRLNEKTACMSGNAHCSEYINKKHSVELKG